MTKRQLLAAFKNDDLEAVIRGFLHMATEWNMPELRSDALIQLGKLETYRKLLREENEDGEKAIHLRLMIRDELGQILITLPDVPVSNLEGKLPGLSEKRFKRSLFWIWMLGLFVVFLWLKFHLDTGGFSDKEFTSTITLLISVFTAYSLPMFNDMLANRYINMFESAEIHRRVGWSLPIFTWLVILPAYYGLMLYFIHLRAIGQWGFEEFLTVTTLLNTMLGTYVGTLVNHIYKKNDP